MFNLILFCGGFSLERGISLNSARSVFDHLNSIENIKISVIYYNELLVPYVISEKFLYSNTPSDFDFKLDNFQMENDVKKFSKNKLIEFLKTADLVFPLIHGCFGEDGQIQHFLSQNNIPFVGSDEKTCKIIFNKAKSKELLKQNNLFCVKQLLVTREEFEKNDFVKIEQFVLKNNLKNIFVKPAESGSSLYVYKTTNFKEILIALKKIFTSYFKEAILEEACEGAEFTVIVLQNENKPVALIPLEIVVEGIFTYGKKYTPSNDAQYYCPPKFSENVTKKIMQNAEKLFLFAGAKDFVRFDGWYLKSGDICFSDFNPISGMEQNSFLFQEGSRIGLTHQDVLVYILNNACKRFGINFIKKSPKKENKKKVNVLFGGISTEKEVSVTTGTNVWLKLLNSKKFESFPYFMENENTVWKIPYSIALSHSTFQIIQQCRGGEQYIEKLKILSESVHKKLSIPGADISKILFKPSKMTLNEFITQSKIENSYVFIGLHGGFGENGKFQKKLEENRISFNGSNSKASALCMDKFKSGEIVNLLKISNMRSARKIQFKIMDFEEFDENHYKIYWKWLLSEFSCTKIIVKPQNDGCSAGVIKLSSYKELMNYILGIKNFDNNFKINEKKIIIPTNKNQFFLFEEFIETDKIFIKNGKIFRKKNTGWLELTVGVLEEKNIYHSLNPSITVAEDDILSLEEKFQGGTGINITPPDEKIFSNSKTAILNIKKTVELVAKALKIKNYARIDIFYNDLTQEVIIIEANTLPALTPSTVFFQQAGKEIPSLTPPEIIEKIIETSQND